MAKELPYFKFEPNEWDSGNIQICSRASKGLFIDLCSIYWSRLGELPYALALQKLCNGDEVALQELVNHDIIAVVDGQIIIEFLDEQLSEFNDISQKRQKAAQKRWFDANALQVESKSNAIREEEKREEKKTEEKKKPLRAFEIPFVVDSTEYHAWLEWEIYKKEKGQTIKPTTAKKQFKFLGGRAGPEIVAILEQSIQNGWTGLFEIKKGNNGTGNIGGAFKKTIRRADAIIEQPEDYGDFRSH